MKFVRNPESTFPVASNIVPAGEKQRTLRANGLFVTLCTPIGLFSSRDFENWYYFDTNANINTINMQSIVDAESIEWNGSMYCMVVDDISFTSTDGKSWTPHHLPANFYTRTVALVDGLFVIARAGTANAYTSPDGETWTARTLPSAIGYDPGVRVLTEAHAGLIIIMDQLTAKVMSSANAITWVEGAMPSTGEWRVIGWDGTNLLAAKTNTAIATSPDGQTWTTHTATGISFNSYQRAAWNGSVFVTACFDGTNYAIYSSANGIAWTSRHTFAQPAQSSVSGGIDGAEFFGPVWTGTNFVIYFSPSGIYDPRGTITYSANGTSGWTDVNTGSLGGLVPASTGHMFWDGSMLYVLGGRSADGGVTWELVNRTTSAATIHKSCYLNPGYAAIFHRGAGRHIFGLTDASGVSWIKVSPLPALTTYGALYSCVAYGAGKYVALTDGSRSDFAYSSDGINWTQSHMVHAFGSTADHWGHILWDGSKFVALSINGTHYATSTDGMTWTVGSTGSGTASLLQFVHGGGIFLAVGVGGLVRSTNGTSWTYDNGYVSQGLCYQDGAFYSWLGSQIQRSVDGITWTQIDTYPHSYESFAISVEGASGFLVQEQSILDLYPNTVLDDLGGSRFRMCGLDGRWITKHITDYINMYTGNGQFSSARVVEDRLEVLTSYGVRSAQIVDAGWLEDTSVDDIYWTSVGYNGSVFVAVGNDFSYSQGRSAYSTNGKSWTEGGRLPNGQDGYLYSLTYGNGAWVAGAYYTSSMYGFVRSTNNGVSWAQVNLPDNANIIDITFNGTLFCAITDDGSGNCYTSTDGSVWTRHTIRAGMYWTCITSKNGVFCVVAGSPAMGEPISATSSDGVTWTQSTTRPDLSGLPNYGGPAVDYYFSAIVPFGNKFVAFGYSVMMVSVDGLVWTPSTILPSATGIGFDIYFTTIDAIATNSYIYLLGSNNVIRRTSDLTTWEDIGPPGHDWFVSALAFGDGTLVAGIGNDTSDPFPAPLAYLPAPDSFWTDFVATENV